MKKEMTVGDKVQFLSGQAGRVKGILSKYLVRIAKCESEQDDLAVSLYIKKPGERFQWDAQNEHWMQREIGIVFARIGREIDLYGPLYTLQNSARTNAREECWHALKVMPEPRKDCEGRNAL